jgi:hypothetical protein
MHGRAACKLRVIRATARYAYPPDKTHVEPQAGDGSTW